MMHAPPDSEESGGEVGALANRLREAGLRPTKQRLAIARLLFENGDRHVTVDDVHAEAVLAGYDVSLATAYNTLHLFEEKGLVRKLAIKGVKIFFDTNTSDHSHFFLEGQGQLIDIPASSLRLSGLPKPPEGMSISHVDVIVRLRKN